MLLVLVSLIAPLVGPLLTSDTGGLPSKAVWLSDVRHSMLGSRAYLHQAIRVADPGDRLAINLDIDNTSLATRYAPGHPIGVVRRFARYAHRHGVAVLFNTGRNHRQTVRARKMLAHAGYSVDHVCHRRSGEHLTHSKQRCRRHFIALGYTVVANVGNRRTDFTGSNYQRAFRLPNYHNRLG